jgi:molybdopterin/thiamine biosynthesis adenylyltransferase
MAAANFFSKSALAVSQVIQSLNYSDLITVLDSCTIGVSFANDTVETQEGKILLDFTVNQLARFYPKIALQASDESLLSYRDKLVTDMQAINPNIDIKFDLENISICIVIGQSTPEVLCPKIYVGSDEWLAQLSTTRSLNLGSTNNPFGAAAASCLAVANVFRFLFKEYLTNSDLDTDVSLSLLNYDQANNAVQPLPENIDLGETLIVGIGAIGNAATWALSKLHCVSGTLHLIDHETVEISNLQRYVLTTQNSIGQSKVAIAQEVLANTNLEVSAHQLRWGDYLREREQWNIQKIAVCVDNAHDRCGIQASLPRWIVNAWTQPENIGISRHHFIDNYACLMCMYLPNQQSKSEDEIIAESLNLPDELKTIGFLLYTNQGVDENFIQKVAAAKSVSAEELSQYVGKPLRTFYSEVMCGGLILALGGTHGKTTEGTVPMAFQSALAGVMMAAELVIHSSGLRESPFLTRTTVDLLHPIREYLSFSQEKDSQGRCICQDGDFIQRYEEKYVAQEP